MSLNVLHNDLICCLLVIGKFCFRNHANSTSGFLQTISTDHNGTVELDIKTKVNDRSFYIPANRTLTWVKERLIEKPKPTRRQQISHCYFLRREVVALAAFAPGLS